MKDRKPGGNNNPNGLGGKTGKKAEDCQPDNDKGVNAVNKYGTDPQYLTQRIAESSLENHEAMKRGEFPSVRSAAIAARLNYLLSQRLALTLQR